MPLDYSILDRVTSEPARSAFDNPLAATIISLRSITSAAPNQAFAVTRTRIVLLLVLPGTVSDRLDSLAGRYVQMGRALKASVRVLIGTLDATSIGQPGVPIVEYSSEQSLRTLVDSSTLALVPGTLFDTFPSLAQTTTRLIVDLSESVNARSPGLRMGDFFVCATEESRESWLRVLLASGRISRRARRNGDLRRLIDVVGPARQRRHGTDGCLTTDPLPDWERAVDPIRLYCTSTSRHPRGWAWAPPSIGARAVRMFREHGARSLVRTSVAYICRHHALTRQLADRMNAWLGVLETGIRPVSGRPRTALPAGDLVTRLASVHSLLEFHEILSEHALLGRGRRFIDLEIDVSNKCNIRCRMCYFSFDHTFRARPVYLRPNTFASIAQTILPHARAVMLSLGSEPLTSPHFVPILELTARHDVPEVGFYTNGLLMNGRVIDAVLANRVTLVAVSVDGATKKTFESIRRGADFDLLLRNVRALVRRRAETGRTLPRVRFGVVMMRQNIEELPDIVTLAWRLGVEELNFFHAVVYEGLEMQEQSLVGYKQLSNHYLERARARALELGLTVVHNPSPFKLDEPSVAAAKSKAALRQTVPYCHFPFFHVSVSADGQVMPCPFSHGEAAFGVLGPETSFEQIRLGPAFNELRRRILTNDPPDMCRRCSFLASSHPDMAELFAARRN